MASFTQKLKTGVEKHPVLIAGGVAVIGIAVTIYFIRRNNSSNSAGTPSTNVQSCYDNSGNLVDCTTGQPLGQVGVSPQTGGDVTAQIQDLEQIIAQFENQLQNSNSTGSTTNGSPQPISSHGGIFCTPGSHYDLASNSCILDNGAVNNPPSLPTNIPPAPTPAPAPVALSTVDYSGNYNPQFTTFGRVVQQGQTFVTNGRNNLWNLAIKFFGFSGPQVNTATQQILNANPGLAPYWNNNIPAGTVVNIPLVNPQTGAHI